MKLFIFNPSHDLALANNDSHFLPPRTVRQMENDLGLLPLCYADEGDIAMTDEGFFVLNAEHRLCKALSEKPDITSVHPWGWNPQIYEKLNKAEISTAILPSTEQLNEVRRLSNREWATKCLLHIRSKGYDWMCGESTFCTSEEEIKDAITAYKSSIIKAPWSGSGRGLRFGQGRFAPPLVGWCLNTLKLQGGLVVEPFYNKVLDFALEFESNGKGVVQYIGLSYFDCTTQGSYSSSIVAPQEVLRHKLEPYLDPEKFNTLRSELEDWLSEYIGTSYTGILGIDCMICRQPEDDTIFIHPCVEINLRQTMGYVAMRLTRWLAPGVEARFCIDYAADGIHSSTYSERKQDENGLLISGSISLTPIFSDTLYCAKLEVID
ncbi:MAG: hypothetical protein RR386_05325 [Bacteroidaceae bacterium]